MGWTLHRWAARLPVAPEWLALVAVLLLGVVLRILILSGPLGEVEADESVVGLMALHIQWGERPVFYWGQPYLGSLEAYLVAGLFSLVGPSNLALKAVPGLAFLGFALLVYFGARHDFGPGPALAAALYLALPPSFLAFWSLKARGGYVELLLLGQALLLLAGWAGRAGRGLAWKVGLTGLVGGTVLWTHLLGLVYLVPVGLYLLTRLRRRLFGWPLLTGLCGLGIGLGPALSYNLDNDWATLASLSSGGVSSDAFWNNLSAFITIGLPILVGLGQATSSPELFAADWPHRLGSRIWVPPLVLAGLLLGAALVLPLGRKGWAAALRADQVTRLGGLALLLLAPLLASEGRFAELVAEPRYALPLYGAVPLFAAAGGRLARRGPLVGWALLALVLGVNLYSLRGADPRLNLPTTAAGSNAVNRAGLLEELERRGLGEVYTDYWLAYPLIFESGERVLASISSGGYNRFAPYAYYVAESAAPGFVFISGSAEQRQFQARLAEVGGSAEEAQVGIYTIYQRAKPLDQLRP
jgi:hypothetical protein